MHFVRKRHPKVMAHQYCLKVKYQENLFLENYSETLSLHKSFGGPKAIIGLLFMTGFFKTNEHIFSSSSLLNTNLCKLSLKKSPVGRLIFHING